MSQPATDDMEPLQIDAAAPPANTVAMIGLIMTGIAGLMCGILFAAARALPAPVQTADTTASGDITTGVEDEDQQNPQAQPDPEDVAPAAADAAREAESARQAEEARDTQVLRVLLLASSTAVLNLVGLILSIAGLFVPNRPRAMAACGVVLSLLLFSGIFGVMAVGAFLNPATTLLHPQDNWQWTISTAQWSFGSYGR